MVWIDVFAGVRAGGVLGRLRIRHQPGLRHVSKGTRRHDVLGRLGVVIGGRLGYVLFYRISDYLYDPIKIFFVWEGGMSFHGGFLGVLVAMLWIARIKHLHFLQVTDFLAPLVPLGLGAGRIGNFINAELWGRQTDLLWGTVFPNVDKVPRHPSQLYEFASGGTGVVWANLDLFRKAASRWGRCPHCF